MSGRLLASDFHPGPPSLLRPSRSLHRLPLVREASRPGPIAMATSVRKAPPRTRAHSRMRGASPCAWPLAIPQRLGRLRLAYEVRRRASIDGASPGPDLSDRRADATEAVVEVGARTGGASWHHSPKRWAPAKPATACPALVRAMRPIQRCVARLSRAWPMLSRSARCARACGATGAVVGVGGVGGGGRPGKQHLGTLPCGPLHPDIVVGKTPGCGAAAAAA